MAESDRCVYLAIFGRITGMPMVWLVKGTGSPGMQKFVPFSSFYIQAKCQDYATESFEVNCNQSVEGAPCLGANRSEFPDELMPAIRECGALPETGIQRPFASSR